MGNTVAHNVFGDPIWTQETALEHRLTWYHTFLEATGLSPPPPPPIQAQRRNLDEPRAQQTQARRGLTMADLLNPSPSAVDAEGATPSDAFCSPPTHRQPPLHPKQQIVVPNLEAILDPVAAPSAATSAPSSDPSTTPHISTSFEAMDVDSTPLATSQSLDVSSQLRTTATSLVPAGQSTPMDPSFPPGSPKHGRQTLFAWFKKKPKNDSDAHHEQTPSSASRSGAMSNPAGVTASITQDLTLNVHPPEKVGKRPRAEVGSYSESVQNDIGDDKSSDGSDVSSGSGSEDESSSDDESEEDAPMKPVKRLLRKHGAPKRTAKWEKEQRDAWYAGSLKVEAAKERRWRNRILKIHPEAEFVDGDVMRYRHQKCGQWLRVKYPYDATRMRQHHKECKGKRAKGAKASAGSQTLDTFAAKLGWAWRKVRDARTASPTLFTTSSSSSSASARATCPGLTNLDNVKIPSYLRRTAARGGGGRSPLKIAQELFKKTFSRLKPKQKRRVFLEQQGGWTWQNDHPNDRVFATCCSRSVRYQPPDRPPPCPECRTVLTSKAFRNAIAKKTPKDQNYIYVNYRYRDEILGQLYARCIGLQSLLNNPVGSQLDCLGTATDQPWSRMRKRMCMSATQKPSWKVARQIRSSMGSWRRWFKRWTARSVALGCKASSIRRIGIRSARQSRSRVRLRIVHSRSSYLHVLSDPSSEFKSTTFTTNIYSIWPIYRMKVARQPRFPMGIGDANFELVSEYLKTLNYDGPVGLSCDDTKLFGTLRLYWDSEKNAHYLVGTENQPRLVPDPDSMADILKECQSCMATKVRLSGTLRLRNTRLTVMPNISFVYGLLQYHSQRSRP